MTTVASDSTRKGPRLGFHFPRRGVTWLLTLLSLFSFGSCATTYSTNTHDFTDPTAQVAAEAIYKGDVAALGKAIDLSPSILESRSSVNYDLLDLSLLYNKPECFSLLLHFGAIKSRTTDQTILMIRRLAVQERYMFLEALRDNKINLLTRSDSNMDLIRYLLIAENSEYYFGKILNIVAQQHNVLSGEYVLDASYGGKWKMMAKLLEYNIDFTEPRDTLELVKKDVSLVRSRGGIYPEVDRQLEIVVAILREKYGYNGN